MVVITRRNLEIGIRVEHRGHVLRRLHAVDVALVDVHLDLQEFMSTIVQMLVRVNPPPADTGDTISPACPTRHAAERRAHDHVVQVGLQQLDLPLRYLDALFEDSIRAVSESTSALA